MSRAGANVRSAASPPHTPRLPLCGSRDEGGGVVAVLLTHRTRPDAMDGGQTGIQGDPPRGGLLASGNIADNSDAREGGVAAGGSGAAKESAVGNNIGSGHGDGDGHNAAAATAAAVATPDDVPETSEPPLKRQKADHPPAGTATPNGAAGRVDTPAASPTGDTGTVAPAEPAADAGGKPKSAVTELALSDAETGAPTKPDGPAASIGDCPTGEEVWASLLASNATFAAEGIRPPAEGVSVTHREALAAGQSPTAVVVTCSDSRVSPELLFSRGLGELFVIRTAGNTTAYDSTVASVEYAVHNLGSPLVVVLGHTKCGAVAAAVSTAADGDAMAGQPRTLSGFVKSALIAPVRAVKERGGVPDADFVSACEVENVAAAVRSLVTTSSWIGKARAGGKVKVVGAIYDLAAGTVTEV